MNPLLSTRNYVLLKQIWQLQKLAELIGSVKVIRYIMRIALLDAIISLITQFLFYFLHSVHNISLEKSRLV